MRSEVAVETRGLTKRFGDAVAVEDLDIAIPTGAVYGVLGPNGAGKTTTLRMLTSLTVPTAGTATVAGVPITNRAALAGRIGYLPADPPVFDELTGREYLRYLARLRGLDGEGVKATIGRYLDRFDLDGDRRVGGYSAGMQTKLGLIGAVLHDPAVLFLDEPTDGLDPRAARTVREMVTDLANRGTTVFLSTHALPVADELADTVGVLADGKLVAEGPPEQLRARAGAGDADLETAVLELTREESAGRRSAGTNTR